MGKPVPKFEDLAGEYLRLWNTMELDLGAFAAVDAAARKVLVGMPRYSVVAGLIGPKVPWEMIGITHLMEADCDFRCHPHNGDSLARRTWQVPAGRPPNPSKFPIPWEESAVDCYGTLKRLGDVQAWPIERMLYTAELFNGWGYRLFHPADLTPYLWAKTNHNDGRGKYVADGRFDENAPSEGQCGFAPVLRRIWEIQGRVSAAPSPAPAPATKDPRERARVAMALQSLLNGLGFGPLVVDGDIGQESRKAIKAFQTSVGLASDGVAGEKTWAAIGVAMWKKGQ